MPRIATSLLRKAHGIDPHLPALLAPCRDLQAAQNELRWLREHVHKIAKARRARGGTLAESALLKQLVLQRASGRPLQYILGSEFFGDLEIRCKPGVLIPRFVIRLFLRTCSCPAIPTDSIISADTAASITHLVQFLRNTETLPPELRVLDLCTGTGCIPLLFQHEFRRARSDANLRLLGVDISRRALDLANLNYRRIERTYKFEKRQSLDFIQADVLAHLMNDEMNVPLPLPVALNYHEQPQFWDILISNPPYISPSGYWATTTRSVRKFEPKLALVPPEAISAQQSDVDQGDIFYPRLLSIARDVEAKIVLFEVADVEQARRVAALAKDRNIFDGIEIWRDQPGVVSDVPVDEEGFMFIGEGQARSVVCWRGAGASWLKKESRTSVAMDAERLFRALWSSDGSKTEEEPEPEPEAEAEVVAPSKDDTQHLEPLFNLELFRQDLQPKEADNAYTPQNQDPPIDASDPSARTIRYAWEDEALEIIRRRKFYITDEKSRITWTLKRSRHVLLKLLLDAGYDVERLIDAPTYEIVNAIFAHQKVVRDREATANATDQKNSIVYEWERDALEYIRKHKLSIDKELSPITWVKNFTKSVLLKLLLDSGYDIKPLIHASKETIVREIIKYQAKKKSQKSAVPIRIGKERA